MQEQLENREHADDRAELVHEQNAMHEVGVEHLEMDGEAWSPLEIQPSRFELFKEFLSENQKAVWLGILGLLLLAGAIGYGVYWYTHFFSEARVEVQFQGPEVVESTDDATYTFTVTNNNKAVLEHVVLEVHFPQSFVPRESAEWQSSGSARQFVIETLAPGQKVTGDFTGTFFGEAGAVATLDLTLTFSPKNISGEYQKTASVGTRIDSSAVRVEVEAPQELVSDQELDYVITYRNEGNETLDNVRVVAEFPQGFSFLSADPGSDALDTWYLSTLRPGAGGRIVVHGRLTGSWNEFQSVVAKIGYVSGSSGELVAYAEDSKRTKMIASPLAIKQVANDTATPQATFGDTVQYALEYKNNSDRGMRDVIVKTEIDSPAVDWAGLQLEAGSYDGGKSIVWQGNSLPALKYVGPGQSGRITFSLPLKKEVPTDRGLIAPSRNPEIVSYATIDSPDVPAILGQNKVVGSNRLSVKLASLVGMDVVAYRNYKADGLPDPAGPFPPQVGQESSYVLLVKLSDAANKVTKGRVVLTLGAGVQYAGAVSPGSESVEYNGRSNELTWNVGTLLPGQRSLAVLVKVKPAVNQAGKEFVLLDKATLAGYDDNTEQDVSVTTDSVKSRLFHEDNLPVNHEAVQK